MNEADTNEMATGDPATLALAALAWVLADERRADRLLALTGLTAEDLRAGLGDTATLAAVLKFLEGHEPDLIACAAGLDCKPGALVSARRELDR